MLTKQEKYTEQELTSSLQRREQSAFSYLYDQYSGALYSVIHNIVTDSEIANDVLQEVFVKIWKQIESYDASKGRLFTWMLNISRNASIDMLRSRQYQHSKQNQELTDHVYEKAGAVSDSTDNIGLKKIVNKLKEDQRVLVELSYFQGYTQDEISISKMLNVPLGTVKTRLRKALSELRNLMYP
jgi:RNA polymerase sigma factor (sigma-70 family)